MANDSRILITPEFRMSYPQLVVPKRYKNKGEPTYNLEMIFAPEDLKKFKLLDESKGDFIDVDVQQMCLAVAKGKWGDGLNVKTEFATKWPIKSGDVLSAKRKGKGAEALLGKKLIKCKASAEYAPTLYFMEEGERKEISRGSDVSSAKGKALFVGGHHAFAELTVKAVDNDNGKFITFYVNTVMFTREDEKFGGGSIFDRYDQSGTQGGESSVDPTQGMSDDDIPF